MSSPWRIPYSEPFLNSDTKRHLLDAYDASELSGNGMASKALESDLSAILGSSLGLTVSNGSAAIRLAFLALGLRPGMRVILPGWGFHVASNVAHSMGAIVEFRDVDLDSWCMNLSDIDSDIDRVEDTFIVLIHTLGNSSRLNLLDSLKSKDNVHIIEDSAEALFSKYKNRFLGTIFDAGTYSFHAAKTVTTGEGGFITLGNQQTFDKARLLRNHGMTPDRPYFHHMAGDNLRLSNLLAALALSQITQIDEIITKRKLIYRQYLSELNLEQSHFLHPVDPEGFFPWGVGVRCGEKRDKIISKLRELSIDSRPGFSSAEELPYFFERGQRENLFNSNTLAKEVVLLPHYPSMTENMVSEICEAITKSLK